MAEAKARAGKTPPRPAVADPFPRRAAAALLAREEGIYDQAIEAVLTEPAPAGSEARSALWWADRMRLRQYEFMADTGERRRAPASVRPPSASRPRPPAESLDPDEVQEVHRSQMPPRRSAG